MRYHRTSLFAVPLFSLLLVANACKPTEQDSSTTEQETEGESDGTGGSEPDEELEIVQCDGPLLTEPDTGTCTVVNKGTNGLLVHATILAPSEVFEGGQIYIDNQGVIQCVGCNCESNADQASIVHCPHGVISPGLINTHDHITFANNRPIGAHSERYDHRHEWRKGQNGHTKISVQSNASAHEILAAELRFVMGGATSTVSAGGRQGLLRNLDSSHASDLEDLPIQPIYSDTFPLDDSDGQQLSQGCNYGGSSTTTQEIANIDAYLPHIAEGVNLAARNEFICTNSGQSDVVAPQTGIVHAIALTADDVQEIHKESAKVVWSPRSNIALYGNTAPVTLLDTLGIPIALGTDWIATGSMNLLRELQCADEFNQFYLNRYFSDYKLWKMVTGDAAQVTSTEPWIGHLRQGALADLAIFSDRGGAHHRAVISAEMQDVALVMRGGKVLYGDDQLVNDLSAQANACEAISVCETQKRACVAQDTNNAASLQNLVNAAANTYPLFFCDPPEDEPSCVPSRSEYALGISKTDSDGDGIADSSDNCPHIFNPIRKLETSQGDADQDGMGDVCDPCPLTEEANCSTGPTDDSDSDGIANTDDNCPNIANPEQEDGDQDGHGDACDACPMEANAGSTPCPASPTPIAAIRNPNHPDHPGEGSQVTVVGAYVTAVRPNKGFDQGFTIQDASAAEYGGIYVFTDTNPANVSVGQRVRVTGVYEEFHGLSEITEASVSIEEQTTQIPFNPIVVNNPAEIATGGMRAEAYESMLVQINNVDIVVANPDAPDDFDEFTVTGNLRIDDWMHDAQKDQGLDNICLEGQSLIKISGVLTYSFDNFKLAPRTKADVEVGTCNPFSP